MLEFLTIFLIILLAMISPGPDFIVVTKNSLCYSRKVGIFSALGVASGTLFHAIYCIFGLVIIISKSLLLFNVIKYIGATYLIYIGIKSLLAKKDEPLVIAKKSAIQISNFQAWRQGFLCNVLNPKCVMFFLALFTLIIKPNTPFYMQIIYGLLNPVVGFIWFSCLSSLITHPPVKYKLAKIQHYVIKLMGGVLIAFGARIATLSHHVSH